MPKVKIIFVEHISDYDDYYSREICRDSTDWTEVSDQEFEFLRYNITRLDFKSHNLMPRLVVADPEPVNVRLQQIHDVIAELKAKDEAAKRAREAKRLQKAKTKLAQKKAAYEKLQAELKEAGVRV